MKQSDSYIQSNWLRAAMGGFAASLAMYALLYIGIYITGIAPFNVTPSAAFLENLGINVGPLPLVVHFMYGMFWSVVFVYIYEDDVTVVKGLLLAMGLWLFMMVVYSPIIGWGMFGFGYAHLLGREHQLYLQPGISYMMMTFLLHVVYGFVIGWLNERWTRPRPESVSEAVKESQKDYNKASGQQVLKESVKQKSMME